MTFRFDRWCDGYGGEWARVWAPCGESGEPLALGVGATVWDALTACLEGLPEACLLRDDEPAEASGGLARGL